MTPIPIAPDYEALNGMLMVRCLVRQSDRAGRRAETIGERLAADSLPPARAALSSEHCW